MKRVLVIEDNDEIRREVAEILGFEGFTVTEAENGRIGLERARERVPELVICDLMMPDLDGYGTLEALRADAPTATVPFLFLTARAERRDMRRGMELGADDYLTKPFTVDELLAAINAVLGKRARIEQQSEAKLATLREQLSTALPHELRTPLACIMGYAEILADPTQSANREEVAEFAQRILGAGMRMNRITENSLLYMQLELLRRHGNKNALGTARPVRLHKLLEAAARAKAEAYGRQTDLVLQLAEATTGVSESYVTKICEELIDNALKFSCTLTPVRVATATESERAVLRVSDQGCGMTREQASAIGAFVQFDRIVREQQGMGLGLAIAHRIAALWGGELAIESAPGKGTTVSVSLPACSTVATTERAAGAHGTGTGRGGGLDG
jgi:signal transduction histidine kinase